MSVGPLPSEPYRPMRPRRRGLRGVLVGFGAAILAVGVVLLLVSLYPASFGLSPRFGFPFGGGFAGVILILWGGLILTRVALRSGRRGRYGPPGRRFDPAIMVARQRYARGEISREQFEQIVQDLRRPPGPPP